MCIDQDFLKILNDVPKDVDAVIIYEDGSWMVAETDMGKSQATVTPPAVSVGQTQVDVFTTTQAQSTTVFTPAATVTPPVVSPCQTPVNVGTTQVKCETMLTPRAVSDQIRVNTTLAQSTGVFTPPAVSQGNITQVKSEIMLTPPTGSDQIRVNTMRAHSTSVFTPPVVSPGNITQVKSETMLTPPAGSTDQIRVNVVTTRAQSTSVFTQPAVSPGNIYTTQAKSTSVFTPTSVSPHNIYTTTEGRSETILTPPVGSTDRIKVNVCTTTQAESTDVFTRPAGSYTKPVESQPTPNIRQVSPTQLPEANGDTTPSGRMRGSLRGDRLQAARLQYLAPPQQPDRANEPWSSHGLYDATNPGEC